MTGPPPQIRFDTWPPPPGLAAWAFAGTHPDAGPVASSGLPLPDADAVLAATTPAQQKAAASSVTIVRLLMSPPSFDWNSDQAQSAHYGPRGAQVNRMECPSLARLSDALRRRLSHPEVVARDVAEPGVDAVRLLRRLLRELDSTALQLLVGLLRVVGREEQSSAGAFGDQLVNLIARLLVEHRGAGDGHERDRDVLAGQPDA